MDTEKSYQLDLELLLSVLSKMHDQKILPDADYNAMYRNYGIVLAISLQMEKVIITEIENFLS